MEAGIYLGGVGERPPQTPAEGVSAGIKITVLHVIRMGQESQFFCVNFLMCPQFGCVLQHVRNAIYAFLVTVETTSAVRLSI